MSELPSKEQETPQSVTCPQCKRTVTPTWDLDGHGKPNPRALRYPQHSGKRWGRLCGQSGELL